MADADAEAVKRQEHLIAGLKNFLDSSKYSDVTVVCGERKFAVHKLVLCLHSTVFAKAFDGEFKEAITGKYEIHDHDLHIVGAMLKFFYGLDYADDGFEDHSLYSQMRYNVLVNAIADEYDVAPLKSLAQSKFRALAEGGGWNHESFPAVVQEIYALTYRGDGLRKVAVDLVLRNAAALAQKDEFNHIEEFEGTFGAELARRMIADAGYKHYCCPTCRGDVVGNFNDNNRYWCNHCGRQYKWSQYLKNRDT